MASYGVVWSFLGQAYQARLGNLCRDYAPVFLHASCFRVVVLSCVRCCPVLRSHNALPPECPTRYLNQNQLTGNVPPELVSLHPTACSLGGTNRFFCAPTHLSETCNLRGSVELRCARPPKASGTQPMPRASSVVMLHAFSLPYDVACAHARNFQLSCNAAVHLLCIVLP